MALRILYNANVRNIVRRFSTKTDKLVNVEVDSKTGISTLTLNRPPVNSLNLELLRDISSTLTQIEKDKSRGIILTSFSPNVFSAGLDILEMYKPDMDRVKAFWTTLQEVWIKLYGTSLPTVALINGHAPAGGCLLSLCCEYRIMLNNFTIGLNETQLGIVAPKWFISSFVNVVGHRPAELGLTSGRLYKTSEALDIGLVDEVASDKEDGFVKAENFFKRFQRVSPVARGLTKLSIREKTIKDMLNDRENDLNTFVSFVTNDDVQKGLGLYLESLKKKASTK